MWDKQEQSLDNSSNGTNNEDRQSKYERINSCDDTSMRERELNDGMAKLQIAHVNELPEKIQQMEQHIIDCRKDEEILKQLKDLRLLQSEITKLKLTPSLEDVKVRTKIDQFIQELNSKMENLQVKDVNTLPEKIQQKEQRIKKYTDFEETLKQLKYLQLLDGKIEASKSNHSVFGAKRCFADDDYDFETNDQSSRNEDNKRFRLNNVSQQPTKKIYVESKASSTPEFFVSLPEVKLVRDERLRNNIREKYRRLCGWSRRGFPGCHSVSMHRENYKIILNSAYNVTWKFTGKRYMMLIEDQNTVYLLDVGDNLFTIDHMQFPCNADSTDHLKDTLVDGEIVLDKIDASNKPCFFINDIIIFQNESVRTMPFSKRWNFIDRFIVRMRDEAIQKGHIKEITQPISLKAKTFFPLSKLKKLLGPTDNETLPYEHDGLVFWPEQDAYTSGEYKRLLKWKYAETIDFLLKISTDSSERGAFPKKEVGLFVNKENTCFAKMSYSPDLEQYNNKVVSCGYKDGQWYVYRSREDRQFPNSRKTVEGLRDAVKNPVTKTDLCDLIRSL